MTKGTKENILAWSDYGYGVWMGEVRGRKMQKTKEAKEETCV